MDMTKTLKQLHDNWKALPPKDHEFACSLLKQWQDKHNLSEKQWYWVDRLAAEATGTPAPVATTTVEVGDFHKVLALFKTAREHLRFPKITLQVGAHPLSLSMAGASAKQPGTVNVTDGRPFGQNVWYGRVTPDGDWQVNLRAPQEDLQAVESFLFKFAAKPAETASEYGRLTGRCCFCNSALTDKKSTAAGFGQTCAKHFGLESEWKAAQPVLKEAA